jgi:hypothetical protein
VKSNEQIIAEAIAEKKRIEDAWSKFKHECIMDNFPDAIHLGEWKYTLAGYEFVAACSLGHLTDGGFILHEQRDLADWLTNRQNPISQWERFKNFWKG